MKNLRRLAALSPGGTSEFHLDGFQSAVLDNLHLEFFFHNCRCIVTPMLGQITTGEAGEDEVRQLRTILEDNQQRILAWRRYVLVNLALYTSLLETNSYQLKVNDHLLICRFVSIHDHPDELLLKLYTIARRDLPANYTDKIYLGRDRMSLQTLPRDHFGIRNIRCDMAEQFDKLRGRIKRFAPDPSAGPIPDAMEDLHESVVELRRATQDLLKTFPASVFTHNMTVDTLLEANTGFRRLKHVLMEMEETLRELEQYFLSEGNPKVARYVTKTLKDVTCAINFLMCKVNGRISHVVNSVDALAYFGSHPASQPPSRRP